MKRCLNKLLLPLVLALFALNAAADTRYVDLNSPSPTPPYTNWVTAATNIQDAIDAADAGDLVLVTNGVYETGGRVVYGAMTNRVAVTKPVTVQSVNGSVSTIIAGLPGTGGYPSYGIRCVYLTNGAALIGFTLTNGATRPSGNITNEQSGAAVWCESTNAIISDCALMHSFAGWYGGGAYQGTLSNCMIAGVTAFMSGGGTYLANLNKCVVTGNTQAHQGSGGGGASFGILNNCLVSSNSAFRGGGAYYCTLSNCIVIGNKGVGSASLGGGTFASLLTSCVVSNNSAGNGGGLYYGVANNSLISSNRVSNSGGGAYSNVLNNCVLSGNFGGGAYQGTLNYCTLSGNFGRGAYQGTLNYCTLSGNVGGGAYQGTLNYCTLSNNWDSYEGGGSHGGTLNNCTLIGNSADFYGGGAYQGTLNNCVLTSNSASDGGGAFFATLNNCILTNNSGGAGGGASGGTLNNCILTGNVANTGGGARSATLNNCTLTGNSATNAGGGTVGSLLYNCVLNGNSSQIGGGGAAGGGLNNCTLSGNWAIISGGGANGATLNNCIVYYNTAPNGNYSSGTTLKYCCTTPLPGTGTGNFTNAPLFINESGGNLRLQSNSPSINAANNSYVIGTTDLDGNPRIAGGTVDIGAYEFQSPQSAISYAWLQQYGLPTDSSADFSDADGDGANNWHEWRADTIPTDALSALRMVIATNDTLGLGVTWQSVSTRNYWLERATNLGDAPPFQSIATNIAGASGTTTYTDTNATNGGPYFYRVGVQ